MTTVAPAVTPRDLGAEFISVGLTVAARRARTCDVRRFEERFGDLAGWRRASLSERLCAPVAVRSYGGWAVVATATAVDADYVTAVSTTWGRKVGRPPPLRGHHLARNENNLPGSSQGIASTLVPVSSLGFSTRHRKVRFHSSS